MGGRKVKTEVERSKSRRVKMLLDEDDFTNNQIQNLSDLNSTKDDICNSTRVGISVPREKITPKFLVFAHQLSA